MQQLPRQFRIFFHSAAFCRKRFAADANAEFITSDRPFYFMCCPHSEVSYPKYIALDPKHLLLIPPPIGSDKARCKDEAPDFNAENMGSIIFRDIEKSDDVDLFNIYTISNSSRFIITHELSESMDTLIQQNIKYKTDAVHSESPTGNMIAFITTHCCNRDIEDKKKDFEHLMKILRVDN